MGAVAIFSPAAWRAEFPEFSAISDAQANGLFTRACFLHKNDGTGPVTDTAMQGELLNLVTGHLCALYLQSLNDGEPGQPKDADTPVGRISSANQGSVSAQFDMGIPASPSRAYWQRTKYGTDYWMLTRAYRSMTYVPGPIRVTNPFRPFFTRWR